MCIHVLVSAWHGKSYFKSLCLSLEKSQKTFSYQALMPRIDDNFDTDVSCLSISDIGLLRPNAAQAASQQRYMRKVGAGQGWRGGPI